MIFQPFPSGIPPDTHLPPEIPKGDFSSQFHQGFLQRFPPGILLAIPTGEFSKVFHQDPYWGFLQAFPQAILPAMSNGNPLGTLAEYRSDSHWGFLQAFLPGIPPCYPMGIPPVILTGDFSN